VSADGTPGIVILGTPRSGTTLLRRLLDAHPSIACPGETNLLAACGRFLESERTVAGVDIGVLSGLSFAGIPEGAVIDRLRELVLGFHRDIAARAGKARWAEKTAVDSFYLGAIERLMAGHAKFIVVNRHGLDFSASMDELCRENGVYLPEIHAYLRRHPMPLEAFARCWVDLTGGLLDFAARHPDDAIVVRYEDLVGDTDTVLAGVLRFLGEEMPADLVGRALRSRSRIGLGDWKTYGHSTVDSGSVGRGAAIPEYARAVVARIINPTLIRAGYAEIPCTESPSPADARRAYELGVLLKGLRRGPA